VDVLQIDYAATVPTARLPSVLPALTHAALRATVSPKVWTSNDRDARRSLRFDASGSKLVLFLERAHEHPRVELLNARSRLPARGTLLRVFLHGCDAFLHGQIRRPESTATCL